MEPLEALESNEGELETAQDENQQPNIKPRLEKSGSKYLSLTIETSTGSFSADDVKLLREKDVGNNVREVIKHDPDMLDQTWQKIIASREVTDRNIEVDFGEIYMKHWRKNPFDDQYYLPLIRMLNTEHPVLAFSDDRRVNLLIEITGGAFNISLHDDHGTRLTVDVNVDRRSVSVEDLPVIEKYELKLQSITRKMVYLMELKFGNKPVVIELDGATVKYSFSSIPNRRENSRIVFPYQSITVEPVEDLLHVELDATALLELEKFKNCETVVKYGDVSNNLGSLLHHDIYFYFTVPLSAHPPEITVTFSSLEAKAQAKLPLFNSFGELICDGIHEHRLENVKIAFITTAHVYPPLAQNKIYKKFTGDLDTTIAELVDLYSKSSDVLFTNDKYSATERYQWIRKITRMVVKCVEYSNIYANLDPQQVIRKSLYNFMTDMLRFILKFEAHHFELWSTLLMRRFDHEFLESYADHLMSEVHTATKSRDYTLLLSLLDIAAYTVYLVKEPLPISLAILKMANVLLMRIYNEDFFVDMEIPRRIEILVMIFTLAFPRKTTQLHEQEFVKFCRGLEGVIKNKDVPSICSPLCALIEYMVKSHGKIMKSLCVGLMTELMYDDMSNDALIGPLWCLFRVPSEDMAPLFEMVVDQIESGIAYQLICAQYIIKFRPELKWKLLDAVSDAPFSIVRRVIGTFTSDLVFPIVERLLDSKLDDISTIFRLYLTPHSNKILHAMLQFAMWELIMTQEPTMLMEHAFRVTLSLNPKESQFKSCAHHSLHRAVRNSLFAFTTIEEVDPIRFQEIEQQLQSIVKETMTIGSLELVTNPNWESWFEAPQLASSLESILSLHFLLDRFVPVGPLSVILDLIQILIRIHALNLDHNRTANSLLLLAAIKFGYSDLAAAFEWMYVVRAGQIDALLESLEEKLLRKFEPHSEQDYNMMLEIAQILDLASDIIENCDESTAEIIRLQAISLFRRLPTSDEIRNKIRTLYERQMLLYSKELQSPPFYRYFSVQLLSPNSFDLPSICNQSHHVIESPNYTYLENELKKILPGNIILLAPSELIPPFDDVDVIYVRIHPAIRISNDTYRTFDHSLQDRHLMPTCISRTLRVNGVGMYASRLSPVLSVSDAIITECEANCVYFEYLLTVTDIDLIIDVFKEELEYVLGVRYSKLLITCYEALYEDQRKNKYAETKRAWVLEKLKADSEARPPPPIPEMTSL
jgi:hypothetical protein